MSYPKTKKELKLRAAAWCGLDVETWSPGDGVTRYKFFPKEWSKGRRSIPTGFAMGLKEAWRVLEAMLGIKRLEEDRWEDSLEPLRLETLKLETLLWDESKGFSDPNDWEACGNNAWRLLYRLEPILRSICGYQPVESGESHD